MNPIAAVAMLAALFTLAACTDLRPDRAEVARAQTATPVSALPAPPVQPGFSRPVAQRYPQFGDYHPHPWDTREPWLYPIHGIDVSRWQTEIDWQTAHAAGVSFAFIKATEGGDVVNPLFAQQFAGAASVGIPHAAYHYYYFCRTADEQADWFIRTVPNDHSGLPHVLDLEWTPTSTTCPGRPDNATILREANRFLDRLEAHYGQRPIVYTTVDFWRDTGIGALPRTEFWLRSVAGHPSTVYPGAAWTFWQYTGTGMVPGIEGKVDINVFAGSEAAWACWRQPAGICG